MLASGIKTSDVFCCRSIGVDVAEIGSPSYTCANITAVHEMVLDAGSEDWMQRSTGGTRTVTGNLRLTQKSDYDPSEVSGEVSCNFSA